MNLLWMILLFPGYGFMGGLVGSRIHYGKGHDREGCDSGRSFPSCFFGGIFWPAVIPLMIMYAAIMLGVNVEAMRPVRRKEKSKEITKAHEKEIYGEVLS